MKQSKHSLTPVTTRSPSRPKDVYRPPGYGSGKGKTVWRWDDDQDHILNILIFRMDIVSYVRQLILSTKEKKSRSWRKGLNKPQPTPTQTQGRSVQPHVRQDKGPVPNSSWIGEGQKERRVTYFSSSSGYHSGIFFRLSGARPFGGGWSSWRHGRRYSFFLWRWYKQECVTTKKPDKCD